MMNWEIPRKAENRKLWDDATKTFDELLNDLKCKGLIRLTIPMDRRRLQSIWADSGRYGEVNNKLVDIFHKSDSIPDSLVNTGFDEGTFINLFLSQSIGFMLIQYESVFKTSFLFFLQEEQGIRRNQTLTQLLRVIERISPTLGGRVKLLIDTDLRNSLAHGTYWFEDKKLILATDSYLQEIKELSFEEFIVEMLRINIVAHALVYTLDKKIMQGFFEP